jgi:hypothetical protein
MKKYALLLLILISALRPDTLSAQIKNRKKENHKVVFQFTNAKDTMQQKSLIRQLQNILQVWPNAQYEVVVHNQGVDLLMEKHAIDKNEIRDLAKRGVKFVVCENTLKSRNIPKSELMQDVVGYVPAGIAEIVLKQEEGWSYIKGGF